MNHGIEIVMENGRMLCKCCFLEVTEHDTVCPHCGYRNEDRASWQPVALPHGTLLAGRYLVGKMLGMGGFGITYLAYDRIKSCRVAIKEYFPSALSSRMMGMTEVIPLTGERENEFRLGAQKFYEEAERIAKFDGISNIINVYEFFYANNTAYYVMEYLDGEDLAHYALKKGKEFSTGKLLYLLEKVTDALTSVHAANLLHRDIAPDNIFICRNGDIKLIDFGAARQYMSQESQSMSVIVKMGFAPIEQYQRKGRQGPWTDIYALGATAYYMLTGKKPDDAYSRSNFDEMDYSSIDPAVAKVLHKMLAVQPAKRFQSVHELKHALAQIKDERIPLVELAEPTVEVEMLPPPTVSKSKKKTGTIIAAAVIAIGLGVAIPVSVSLIQNSRYTSEAYSEGLEYFSVDGGYEVKIGTCTDTNIVIPSRYEKRKVIGIFAFSFKNNQTLTSVTLPDTVKYIGSTAFYNCKNLTTVNFSDNLETIESHAFCYCSSLSSVSLPESLKTIEKYAFYGCSSLTEITIPSGVDKIEDYTFAYTGLIAPVIPENITSIGKGAFDGCDLMDEIYIPASVTSIDKTALSNCWSLYTIYFAGTQEQWDALELSPIDIGYARVCVDYKN